MWYNINGGIKIGKKIGIVVEYNPFHNGHLYQIEKIREKFAGFHINPVKTIWGVGCRWEVKKV